MIFGKTTLHSENVTEFNRAKVCLRNEGLLRWHNFLAVRPVELLDGRTAICSVVERKFYIDATLTRYRQDIEFGHTDILTLKKKDIRSWGYWEYRERGSVDNGSEPPELPVYENPTVEEVADAYDVLSSKTGRREAVLAQRARKELV